MSKQLKAVPKFANETEERTFWEKHDSANYLDWTKTQRAVLWRLDRRIECTEIELKLKGSASFLFSNGHATSHTHQISPDLRSIPRGSQSRPGTPMSHHCTLTLSPTLKSSRRATSFPSSNFCS